MTLAQTVILIYGIFTFIGGVIGFLKAKSKASLIAGGISGIVLLICAIGIRDSKGEVTSPLLIALAISLILGIRFFKTWKLKKKWMPDLIMLVLSFISSITILWELIR